MARNEVIAGCGFNPRDPAGQIYNIADSPSSLIGTSEITLAGLYAGRSLVASELPIKMAGYSHCFRMEAGSGQASRGLYRLH